MCCFRSEKRFVKRMKARKVKAVDKESFAPERGLTVDGIRYRMSHQLGVGAFAKVYKASDEWGNDLVVKVYEPGKGESLWRNEVRRLQQFRGPSVAYLHRVFQHEGYTYLVMDNAGVPVSRCRFDSPEMRVRAALFVARGLLQVLVRLHDQECFHGDISPQNVLLRVARDDRLERTTLVDFALCQSVHLPADKSPTMAQWTPPPEYWLKEPLNGPALDIWHAGVLLLQMIKGEILDYSEADVLTGLPSKDAHSVGLPFATALATALAQTPSERPNALALWRTIRAAL